MKNWGLSGFRGQPQTDPDPDRGVGWGEERAGGEVGCVGARVRLLEWIRGVGSGIRPAGPFGLMACWLAGPFGPGGGGFFLFIFFCFVPFPFIYFLLLF